MLGMGVFLGQSTKIYDRATGGDHATAACRPGRSWSPAAFLRATRGCQLYCAVIVKQVDAKTRSKTSINELLARVTKATMSVNLKSEEDIEGMRVAGRLASELLDYLTPHVKPGITTGEINDLAHDYMVNVQQTIPGHAQLRAARAFALSGVAVHVGQSRRVPRHPRRQEIEGRRHRQHRRHRDQGRLSRRHEPDVPRRQAVDPGQAPVRDHL